MKKKFLGALALAGVLAGPAISFAASYAYVDQTGDVRMVEATSAESALVTAPNIHMRSGVMIIDTTSDEDLVGDDVAVQ